MLQYRNQTSQAVLLVGPFVFPVGHPHKMVFVEPSHVFLDEMIDNQDDPLTFELWSLPGVSKVTISVGTHKWNWRKAFWAYPLGKCPLGWWTGYGGKTYPNPSSLLWQCQLLLHDKASFASDGQKGFPHSYQVLWDRACLHYAVWVWKWHWKWEEMHHLRGNSYHPLLVC